MSTPVHPCTHALVDTIMPKRELTCIDLEADVPSPKTPEEVAQCEDAQQDWVDTQHDWGDTYEDATQVYQPVKKNKLELGG